MQATGDPFELSFTTSRAGSCTEDLPSQSPRLWAVSYAQGIFQRTETRVRRSAARGLINVAHCVLAGIRNREPRLNQNVSRARAVLLRTCPEGDLRRPGAADAVKIQTRRWGRVQAISRLPRTGPKGTVALEAAPAYQARASTESRCRCDSAGGGSYSPQTPGRL